MGISYISTLLLMALYVQIQVLEFWILLKNGVWRRLQLFVLLNKLDLQDPRYYLIQHDTFESCFLILVTKNEIHDHKDYGDIISIWLDELKYHVRKYWIELPTKQNLSGLLRKVTGKIIGMFDLYWCETIRLGYNRRGDIIHLGDEVKIK